MAVISGAEILVRTLKTNDIRYVFGTPGSTFTEVLDSLVPAKIKFMLSLHESCAIGMADGYARATGKPGFVMVHDAPGTANIVGGLINAQSDRSPLVIVAAQRNIIVPSIDSPNQTYEQNDITKPFTKWSWQVPSTEYVNEALSRAFDIASRPPTGPVFLGIPQKVLNSRMEWKDPDTRRSNRCQEINPDPAMIEEAARLLIRAKNPVFVAGNEVRRSGAVGELEALADLLAARVVSEPLISFSSFPLDNIYYLGGHLENPKPVGKADILLGAGCRLFLDKGHTAIPPISKRTRVIHIHEDPWEIGRGCRADVGIIANVKAGLSGILRQISMMMTEEKKSVIHKRAEVIKRERDKFNSLHTKAIEASWKETSSIKPLRLFSEMKKRLGAETIIIEEAATMRHHIFALFDSCFARSGCLGWGIPAAIGVKLGLPEKQVVACLGDGSVMFGVQALWTASRYRIPIKVIILNNRGYHAIRLHLKQKTKEPNKGKFFMASDIVNPEIDFVKLADSFDIYGRRISTPREIGPALEEVLSLQKPAILDVVIDQELIKPRGWK